MFLLASLLLALRWGALRLSTFDIVRALLTVHPQANDLVIRSLRLPRVVLAGTVGAALAVSGALLQGITRNPLGSPEIFGIVAGTELGAVLILYVFGIQSTWLCTVAGLLCGALTLALVFAVAHLAPGADAFTASALAGYSVSILVEGLTDVVIKWRDFQFAGLEPWAEGSIGGRDPGVTYGILPCIGLGVILAFAFARQLNVMNLGEEAAVGLGIRFGRARLIGLTLVLVLTALAVTAAGPIGFLGLVIPNLVRLFTGPDYRLILLGSVLLGAASLILGDLAARTLLAGAYDELPITALTAAVGAPTFLVILRRRSSFR